MGKEMNHSEKGKMFLKHCRKHPKDVLRLSKAAVLYGTTGVKARAGELARKEWEKQEKWANRDKIDIQGDKILFSVVMPVYNVDIKWLDKALQSVMDQTYPYWEVCIADDASTDGSVREYLSTIKDSRIKVHFSEENQGISGASNQAAKMAEGDYIILMDNDDEIAKNALMTLYKKLKKTKADVIYSDMDMIDAEGVHSSPLYKPDWSPELMLSQMYLGHLIAFKRGLFEQCGGFNSEYDGAQDYDLLLRMSELTNQIVHVPEVLYSWRMLPTSTAANADAKPYAQIAGKRAIQAHLDRVLGDGKAEVYETENLFVYDVRYSLDQMPLASIIIPTKDHVDDLAVALDSVFEKTTYPNYEIIILDNNSEQEETRQFFKEIQQEKINVKVVEAYYEFNWSKLNNHGMREANGDVFVFLNNDVKVIEPSWLDRLVEQAVQPNAGVVGGQLLYEDGTIQHAGVVIGMGGWADHVFKGMQPIHQGTPFVSPMVTRNVTACTGACMAISKEVIDKIGGFEERFIICGSDVEICIRAIQEGYRNVYIPQVQLYHYESKSRDSYIPEIDFELSDIMYMGYRKGGDPYYNKNLDINSCVPVVKKVQEIPKADAKRISIETIRELHFREETREKYRLNLVLPSLNTEHVFGGIATALKCFEAIGERLDCDTRVILIDAQMDEEAIAKYGKRYQIVDAKENSSAKHQIVSMVDRKYQTLPVSEKDQFMFTSWWSAYVIQNEYYEWVQRGHKDPNPFLYLIQDYEPGFYAWSSGYLLAESTYKCEFPQIAIFNSHELEEYVMAKGYHFLKTYCFDPVLNRVLGEEVQKLDQTVFKRKQILVYGRPSVERNAFKVLVESLKKWVSMQEDASSWTILSAGEMHPPVYLGEGMYLESVGKLTIEEYAKVLRESYAGVSLMVSPHPSYPPLEMSVFDVKVVTNGYRNKDISSFNENIVSVDNVSPMKIAQELKEICDNYHTLVPHKSVNKEYVNGIDPFPFIEELKKDILNDII